MFEQREVRRRARNSGLQSALPYVVIVMVGGGVGAWASATKRGWGIDNWIELSYGAFVAFALTYIGRRQHRVQQAISDLELREKIGVIEASALRASSQMQPRDPLMSLYVASDARAALHLFSLARPQQQIDLLIAVRHAFQAMAEGGLVDDLHGEALKCANDGVCALYQELQDTLSLDNAEARDTLSQVQRFKEQSWRRIQDSDHRGWSTRTEHAST